MSTPARNRRRWRVALLTTLVVLLVPLILFVVNGTVLASGESALVGRYAGVPDPPPAEEPVTVVAYNVAKGFAHRGGVSFDSGDRVRERLRRMAAAIRDEQPDLVFLSEVMTECTPCPVNQVEFLARECGLPHWAFGENYNFGLPFLRVVGGNAILSRTPLRPAANLSLTGRKPFYETKNSRRALFVTAEVRGRAVLLGSLHNDSFDTRNNAAQVRQLLEFVADQPCVLAGDFNAKPDQEPIRLLRECGRFVGEFAGPPTFPADAPDRRIDFAFAPRDWDHIDTRVIETAASDHRPVVARFRVPRP
jgi:endonuclease/exonuclease/phosphatase family metal-dependent hydrolase